MPSNPEMSRFLYTIVKQLDLKSIDWNLVSSELGITNGHAARMRYSRFKQQMEGNTPVRRTRNPNNKRASKAKRPKDEQPPQEGGGLRVKTEEGASSMNGSLTRNTSPVTPSDPQDPHASIPPEAIMVKSESRDPSMPASVAQQPSYSHPGMPMPNPETSEQRNPPSEQVSPDALGCDDLGDFSYQCAPPSMRQQQQQQQQQPQRLYPPMGPQVHEMMEQHLGHDMVMIEHHDLEPFLGGLDLYHPMNDLGCTSHPHLMGPMVKVEERWDASYGRS